MIPLRDANPARTTPFVNYTLIVLNVGAFLFELSLGPSLAPFVYNFGVVPARFLEVFDVGTIVSSMFLHGGWMHLIGNMLFLHVFGDNVEDRFGHGRYVLFYLLAGTAASLTQVFINPNSGIPMVGASGAIAGVLGAYIFMFPTAKVSTLIPIFFFIQVVELPAFMFLGIWFLVQIVSGLFALRIAADVGGVAWWAHIGGFVSGVVMIPFLRKR